MLDVGSPFEHATSGILYAARHLPQAGRDGLKEYLDEIEGLVNAVGGRVLGLFSSTRAAKAAAEALRDKPEYPILCQGDDATGLLVEKFAEDERTCLFGTLSLWQCVDVPGPSLRLVIMDRIPFPRPDDPLASARQKAVKTVAATHAALLPARGAGRCRTRAWSRSSPRASLPPFWTTYDSEVVRAALKRLDAAQTRWTQPRQVRTR